MSTPTSDPENQRTPGTAPEAAPAPGTLGSSSADLGPAGGQHAASRPYPPSAEPVRPGETVVMPVAAAPVSSVDPGADDRRRLADEERDAAERRTVEERRLAEDRELQGRHADAADAEARRAALPEAPPKPGLGRHLLGILLGLVVTPVALLLTGIGTARLADVVSTEEAVTDPLGLTLLILGVVLLAVVVLLGAWSPAVPVTGGLVWGIGLGIAFLVVPDVMRSTLESMSADRVIPGGVEQLAETAMSGTLLVTGTLLLAAGISAARARRRGRRWAEGVAVAQAARRDAGGPEHRAR